MWSKGYNSVLNVLNYQLVPATFFVCLLEFFICFNIQENLIHSKLHHIKPT